VAEPVDHGRDVCKIIKAACDVPTRCRCGANDDAGLVFARFRKTANRRGRCRACTTTGSFNCSTRCGRGILDPLVGIRGDGIRDRRSFSAPNSPAPDRPCGRGGVRDGSFLMTPHALATAVEYDIPVVCGGMKQSPAIARSATSSMACSVLANWHQLRDASGQSRAVLAGFRRVGEVVRRRPRNTVTHAGEVEDAIATPSPPIAHI